MRASATFNFIDSRFAQNRLRLPCACSQSLLYEALKGSFPTWMAGSRPTKAFESGERGLRNYLERHTERSVIVPLEMRCNGKREIRGKVSLDDNLERRKQREEGWTSWRLFGVTKNVSVPITNKSSSVLGETVDQGFWRGVSRQGSGYSHCER